MKKEYVLVHAQQLDCDEVLLIHKKRPSWMAGRLNLCGGKIEEGESPIAAAIRELKEESGLPCWPDSALYCGTVTSANSYIHCIRVNLESAWSGNIQPRIEEDEKVEWFRFAVAFADPRLMPNLQVIIPLMHNGITGWKINDINPPSDNHEITVTLPLQKPFTNGKD
jgi:8-oxo-dGTP pyrophosphatase MutT (NUDIX family)